MGTTKAGAKPGGSLSFEPADLLEVDLGARFALVFIALNSLVLLGTRERQAAGLRAAARHLRPGGLLVVDIWLPDPADLALYDGRLNLEWERTDPETGLQVAKVDAARHDPATGHVEMFTWFDTWSADGGPVSRISRDRSRPIGDGRRTGHDGRGGRPQGRGHGGRPPRRPIRPGRGAGRRPGALGIVGVVSGSSDQIRLLLVEDVPQVAQYVRGLLNAQSHIKLLDVVSDGRKVPEFVREGHPDIVMIDALLQGKVRGLNLAASLRQEGLATPIVIVTVPQNPIVRDPDKGIDAVLAMPFSGFELINLLQSIMAQAQAEKPEGRSRVFSVFAPKGGVGKTTIAFNLAVALAQTGDTRTALVDGSLQFGDMRSLLRVPADAPSILDLPTDRISESDLSDVLWRDPSGIDILLAPPRVEMHEMLSVRDVDKT